jgi:peptidoglycan/xylan/chitin deacetylase (PgdA/CDA1 family)
VSRRDETLVICYHAVSAVWRSPLAVTPAQLKTVISDLLEEGFEGVTFTDAVTEPDRGKRLAVTFDDAYQSVVELAQPILARLGIPGTVFAPTAHIGLDAPRGWDGTAHWLDTAWDAELRHASWKQLAGLAAEGWEIGSHSRTHPHLRSLDDSRLAEELVESRRDCERELGTECLSLAYPYGEADARVCAATAAAGYRAAALLSYRLPVRGRPDPLRWPRLAFQVDDRRVALKTWLFRHSPRAWNAAEAARDSLRRLAAGRRR